MPADAKKLLWTLQKLGLSDPAIKAAWPGWWSDDGANSASAHAELFGGTLGMAILGTLLATTDSYRVVFLATAALTAAILTIGWLGIERTRPAAAAPNLSARSIRRRMSVAQSCALQFVEPVRRASCRSCFHL